MFIYTVNKKVWIRENLNAIFERTI